jgi:hypothetical protein
MGDNFTLTVAYIIPSGGDIDIEANGVSTSSQEYQDVQDAGETFVDTSYLNITFARLGYLF